MSNRYTSVGGYEGEEDERCALSRGRFRIEQRRDCLRRAAAIETTRCACQRCPGYTCRLLGLVLLLAGDGMAGLRRLAARVRSKWFKLAVLVAEWISGALYCCISSTLSGISGTSGMHGYSQEIIDLRT
jgi:hypothetical protein